MAAELIEGKTIAASLYADIERELASLKGKGVHPKLVVVLVGDDPASQVYVRKKSEQCQALGMASETLRLDASTSQAELLEVINRLNSDVSTHGILVQMPLPKQINDAAVIEAISPQKDVDGFHPHNKGLLQSGDAWFAPCTPAGIVEMLMRSGNDPAGKHAVIIGRSQIVGMPLALMLASKRAGGNATVTICHSRTPDIGSLTRSADIVIAAVGVAHFVKADMLSEKAVVIDVGVNRVEDASRPRGYRLVGDVDFDASASKVKAISPVPGGVGPLTIAMLMHNTVRAAKLQHG